MSDLKEKAAYLRGLIEGADYTQDPKQKLIWEGLMDYCDGVADDLDDLGDSQNDFADYIEAIDEDLGTLEKYFYNQDDDEDEEVVFTADGDSPVVELTCPQCKEEVYFEEERGNYEVTCPECGSVVWNSKQGETGKTTAQTDVI